MPIRHRRCSKMILRNRNPAAVNCWFRFMRPASRRRNCSGIPPRTIKTARPRRRAVPGHEFSGVVAAVGEDAKGFDVGEEVYGMNDWFADGATAEYCITQPGSIAPKPAKLTHVEAASVPLAALTAWQGLFDRAKLRRASACSCTAAPAPWACSRFNLRRSHGAQVITTASAQNFAFVKQLGAEQVIDYQRGAFRRIHRGNGRRVRHRRRRNLATILGCAQSPTAG